MGFTYYWLKLWFDILNDPKVQILDDHTWRRFVEILLIAGMENEGGFLPTPAEMAWKLRTTTEDIESVLNILMKLRKPIIVKENNRFKIKNFEKRQAKISGADRQRGYRERLAKESYDNGYTTTKRNLNNNGQITNRNADIDTDIESDIDIEKEPSSLNKNHSNYSFEDLSLPNYFPNEIMNPTQFETIKAMIDVYFSDRVKRAFEWAAKKGMILGEAVIAVEKCIRDFDNPKMPNLNTREARIKFFSGNGYDDWKRLQERQKVQ
jgi:hypothetical protein